MDSKEEDISNKSNRQLKNRAGGKLVIQVIESFDNKNKFVWREKTDVSIKSNG